MNYNLALTNYVDLDDKEAKKSYVLKNLLAGIILTIAYLGGPVVIVLLLHHHFSRIIKLGIWLLFIAIMAYLIIRSTGTTKLFNHRINQGKVRILTTIFLSILLLFLSARLGNLSSVLKLSIIKILSATILALMAGVIEELLFRGLFFNMFVVIFEKNKYFLIWASLLSSVLFGLIHLVNLTHQPLKSTVGQIMFAITLGLILSYCRMITNNVILGIIIHTYIDFQPQIITSDTGSRNLSLTLLFVVFMIVIALVLICIYAYNRRYNNVTR